MAITLPFPVRVAAGILATGIDLVRSLPDDIPAIPVTLVGNAMRLSMKVQQEIATLATRGDELLGGVIGGPQENPAWAKFDDDQPVARRPQPRPRPQPVATSAPSWPQQPAAASMPSGATPEPADSKPVAAEPVAAEHAAHQHGTDQEGARETGTTSLTAPESIDDLSEVPPGSVIVEETEQLTEHLPIPADPLGDEADDEPAALPGYDRMTLAQVRGHLRELTAADVSTLLRYEQDGDSRPPFLTLLSNRLVTLDARNS